MDASIRRCEALIGSAVGAGNGWLLKSRGEGDSTLSVFSQSAAMRYGRRMAAQQSLLAEPWPVDAPICVRIAVHTGKPSSATATTSGRRSTGRLGCVRSPQAVR